MKKNRIIGVLLITTIILGSGGYAAYAKTTVEIETETQTLSVLVRYIKQQLEIIEAKINILRGEIMKPVPVPAPIKNNEVNGLVISNPVLAEGPTAVDFSIISPSKGEIWYTGETYTIQWFAPDEMRYVDITLDTGIRCIISPCPSAIIIAKKVWNSGAYSWTIPEYLGASNAYRVVITDNENKKIINASNAFSIIKKQSGNEPPVIKSISGPKTLNVNEKGTWKITAIDNDSRYLTYTADWGEKSSETMKSISDAPIQVNVASISHVYVYEGTYTIIFTVTDDSGNSTRSKEVVTVKDEKINHAPKIIGFPAIPSEIIVGQNVSFSWEATDEDNDALNWSVTWGDQSISGVGGTETHLYMPKCISLSCSKKYTAQHAWNAPGIYVVSVKVTDNKGGIDYHNFKIEVLRATKENIPPIITGISGPTHLSIGEKGVWIIQAYDPEKGPLSYSVTWGDEYQYSFGLSSGATMPVSGEATFQHSYTQKGLYKAIFTISDNKGAEVETSITVQVE